MKPFHEIMTIRAKAPVWRSEKKRTVEFDAPSAGYGRSAARYVRLPGYLPAVAETGATQWSCLKDNRTEPKMTTASNFCQDE